MLGSVAHGLDTNFEETCVGLASWLLGRGSGFTVGFVFAVAGYKAFIKKGQDTLQDQGSRNLTI